MSFLTTSQLQTLKANIAASEFSGLPQNSDSAFTIAAAYNQTGTPNTRVWKDNVPIDTIHDNITWANFTPTDTPDGTATWTNRALACQGKQFNLQNLLLGKAFINATKATLRAGLQDALTNIPAGASGANVNGGWPNVKNAIQRSARRFELLFATGGDGSSGNPHTLPSNISERQGLSYQDILEAFNS